jgi:DNA-binding PucR family transcriptional regulator
MQEKAESEIGETPEVRDKGLREFREWIFHNPRIEKCRMDSKFLLRFLRCHKYIMTRVKESFERYLIFREGLYGYDWFTNLDPEREHLQDLLEKGMYIVLPGYADTGEKVVMMRTAVCNPDPEVYNVSFTLTTLIMETLFDEDEENQIRGIRYILDVGNIRMKHYFVFGVSTWLRIMKNIERTLVARHKGCHVINMNAAFKFVAKLATHNMKEKLRGGVHFHGSADELKDYMKLTNLPSEYGGSYSIDYIVGE